MPDQEHGPLYDYFADRMDMSAEDLEWDASRGIRGGGRANIYAA